MTTEADTIMGQQQQQQSDDTLPPGLFTTFETPTTTTKAETTFTEAQTTTTEAQTTTTEAQTTTTEAQTTTTEAQTTTTEAQTTSTEAPTATTKAQTTTTEAETTTAEAQTTTMGQQQQPEDNTTPPGLFTRGTTIAAVSETTTMMMTTITTMTGDGSQVTQSVDDVTCNVTSASECVRTAYQSLLSSLVYFVLNDDVDYFLLDVCRKYPSHRGCVKESVTACTAQERLLFDTGLSAFDFICFEGGSTAARSVLPCLSNAGVIQDLGGCSAQVSNVVNNTGLTPCSVASNYANCVNQAFQQRCTGGATDAMQDFLNAALRPLNFLYSCPALSFTLPPPTPSSDTANTTIPSSVTSSNTDNTTIPSSSASPDTTDVFTTTEPQTTPSSDSANSTVQSSTLSSATEEAVATTEPLTTTVTVQETTEEAAVDDLTMTEEATSTTTTGTTTSTTRPTTPSTTTTTTTTTPPRPAFIQCYDCNSGNPGGWTNPHCTTTGDITPGIVTTTSCRTSCFARVTRFPQGAVYRGCSDGWEYTFPDGFPKSGCHVGRNGETWCFCDAHNCNNMDMTSAVNSYLP
ncbi:integumentary mucin C.1-like [Littorina saxatilis]|uniref:integumentary mucin C.1-like n=1 Tax=Littorina saxatilis TaxID=31220 RepID=UPI0038B62F6F